MKENEKITKKEKIPPKKIHKPKWSKWKKIVSAFLIGVTTYLSTPNIHDGKPRFSGINVCKADDQTIELIKSEFDPFPLDEMRKRDKKSELYREIIRNFLKEGIGLKNSKEYGIFEIDKIGENVYYTQSVLIFTDLSEDDSRINTSNTNINDFYAKYFKSSFIVWLKIIEENSKFLPIVYVKKADIPSFSFSKIVLKDFSELYKDIKGDYIKYARLVVFREKDEKNKEIIFVAVVPVKEPDAEIEENTPFFIIRYIRGKKPEYYPTLSITKAISTPGE